MGVHGLWQLIEPVGQPVALESLEGNVLAIDISIWLNQSVKGMRDKTGLPVANAHLLGLFHRICKLLFYRIKPVFVFDGDAPQLKAQTIAERQKRKHKALQDSRKATNRVLRNFLETQVETPLPDDLEILGSEHLLSTWLPRSRDTEEGVDMFLLPEEEVVPLNIPKVEVQETEVDKDQMLEFTSSVASKLKSYQNIEDIDIDSNQFKTLPAELRHEFLTELREQRKGWAFAQTLPKESQGFSSYQMSRLIHKRNLQRKIEETQQEINRTVPVNHCTDADEGFGSGAEPRRVMSDESTRFIFITGRKGSGQVNDKQMTTTSIPEIQPVLNSFSRSNDIFGKVLDFDYGKSEASRSESSSLISTKPRHEKGKVSEPRRHWALNPQEKVGIEGSSCLESEVRVPSDLPSSEASSQVIEKQEMFTKLSRREETEVILEEDEAVVLTGIMSDSDSEDDADDNVVVLIDKTQDSIVMLNDSIDEIIRNIPSPAFINPKLKPPLNPVAEDKEAECPSTQTTNTQYFNHEDVQHEECLNSQGRTFGEKLSEVIYEELEIQSQSQCSKSSIPANGLQSIIESPSKGSSGSASASSSSQLSREEIINLKREVSRNQRYAESVSDRMIQESKELLSLFGIPYVTSPMEAEAQCAILEANGLTVGTITDDSDVWLFGGNTVYKNFFTQSKYLEKYRSSEIRNHFNMTRESMICFALLTGSDYTEGVEGIGPVAAVEVLSEFQGQGLEPLIKFSEWWRQKKGGKEKSPGNKTRAKLLKAKLEEGFPNVVIYDAYVNPRVDDSHESFSWGSPDLDMLRRHAREKFGWNESKIDDLLLPVIKKMNVKQNQARIDDYFKPQLRKGITAVSSKRLVNALSKFQEDTNPSQSASLNQGPSQSTQALSLSKLRDKVRKQRVGGRGRGDRGRGDKGPNVARAVAEDESREDPQTKSSRGKRAANSRKKCEATADAVKAKRAGPTLTQKEASKGKGKTTAKAKTTLNQVLNETITLSESSSSGEETMS